MKHTKKLLASFGIIVTTLAVATAGWAYWSTAGSGQGSAAVSTLAAPTNVQGTSTAGTGMVALTWTGVSAPNGVSADLGYWVQRSKDGGAYSNACGSSHASPLTPSTVASCNDTGLVDGSYTHKVTAVFRSWTATSNPSSAVTVSNVGPLDHFLVTAPSAATAGTPFSITVTAQDAANRTVTTFGGPVHFTSTDGQATSGAGLPSDYTFTTGTGNDNGVHVFTSGVTLKATGSQTVSVSGDGKTGTSATIAVSPATASSLVLAASSTTPTAGAANSLTITAKDAHGNTDTAYTGDKTLIFGGAATIGLNVPTVTNKTGVVTNFGTATTIAFTNGVATVSGSNNGQMKLYKAETASIVVSDGTISNGIGLSVIVSPATASTMQLAACAIRGSSVDCSADQPFELGNGGGTLTASIDIFDAYGNIPASTSATINLASDNTSQFSVTSSVTVTGSGSPTNRSGQLTVTKIGNSSGTATITASRPGFSNLTFNVEK